MSKCSWEHGPDLCVKNINAECHFDPWCEHKAADSVKDEPAKARCPKCQRVYSHDDNPDCPECGAVKDEPAECACIGQHTSALIDAVCQGAKDEPVVRYFKSKVCEPPWILKARLNDAGELRVMEYRHPGNVDLHDAGWPYHFSPQCDVEITAAEYEAAKHPAPVRAPIEPLSIYASNKATRAKVIELERRVNALEGGGK